MQAANTSSQNKMTVFDPFNPKFQTCCCHVATAAKILVVLYSLAAVSSFLVSTPVLIGLNLTPVLIITIFDLLFAVVVTVCAVVAFVKERSDWLCPYASILGLQVGLTFVLLAGLIVSFVVVLVGGAITVKRMKASGFHLEQLSGAPVVQEFGLSEGQLRSVERGMNQAGVETGLRDIEHAELAFELSAAGIFGGIVGTALMAWLNLWMFRTVRAAQLYYRQKAAAAEQQAIPFHPVGLAVQPADGSAITSQINYGYDQPPVV